METGGVKLSIRFKFLEDVCIGTCCVRVTQIRKSVKLHVECFDSHYIGPEDSKNTKIMIVSIHGHVGGIGGYHPTLNGIFMSPP